MNRYMIVALWTIGSLLVAPAGLFAERHALRAFPPDRTGERPTVSPIDAGDGVHPTSRNLYDPPISLDPVFLPPLTKRTDTAQAGVAGWTVPGTPEGARAPADPDGSLGFGFAAKWGGPPVRRRN